MADLQGARRKITEMAVIYTERQFADLCVTDESVLEKEYVRLDMNQVRGELCGNVTKGPLKMDSVAVMPKSCPAHYLAFLLCSLPGQLFLFGQKFNVLAKTKINKKIVSALNLFEVDKVAEDAYVTAEMLKEAAYTQYLENKDDLNCERLYRLLVDLCDMLAVELYAHPLFEEKGIYILENWKLALKNSSNNYVLTALFALSDSNSALRNEIMKAHILVQDVNDYIK